MGQEKARTTFKLSRRSRILLGVGIAVLLLCAALVGLFLLKSSMFERNVRFTLRKVQVAGDGWWHNRKAEVSELLFSRRKRDLLERVRESGERESLLEEKHRMDLNCTGEANLFALDLTAIRTRLEKEPGIRRARVARKLPDTIRIRIEERIPRAVLVRQDSPCLVDLEGVVIPRGRSIPIAAGLPLIVGFRKPVPPFGKVFPELLPALQVIELAIRHYPEIRFHSMNLNKPDVLKGVFSWNGNPRDRFLVLMPLSDPELNLDRLVTSLRDVRRRGAPGRVIDLRFKGRTILKNRE